MFLEKMNSTKSDKSKLQIDDRTTKKISFDDSDAASICTETSLNSEMEDEMEVIAASSRCVWIRNL